MAFGSPLAYVAAHGGGATRRRRDMRIAAVLAEFGYSTHAPSAGSVPTVGAEMLERVGDAKLVVCDLVRPGEDIPVEVAIAATRGIPVLALVPADAVIEGMAAQLLRECGADVVRYERAEPHQVLHARLAEREMARSGRFATA